MSKCDFCNKEADVFCLCGFGACSIHNHLLKDKHRIGISICNTNTKNEEVLR